MPRRRETRTWWDLLIGILTLLIEFLEAIRNRDKPATHFELRVGPIRDQKDT